MASIINVDTINEKTTGNGVQIPGHVVQVVQDVQTGTQISTAQSYVDITGMSASITPTSASSKIMVQWSVHGYVPTAHGIVVVPARGSTRFYYDGPDEFEFYAGADLHFRISNQYLDSPATSSSITYKLQMRTTGGANTQVGSYGYPMTLTLMEIAQ
jgi:hypothetical protein